MDPKIAMLLPKGTPLPKGMMINTDGIYKEVASFPIVPPEKIWEYWHVYTIIFRNLNNPTALRLESFWWHVWGSDRRYLSGAALAKLYEDISKAPTFVPLEREDGEHGPRLRPRNDARDDGSKDEDKEEDKGDGRDEDRSSQKESPPRNRGEAGRLAPTIPSSSKPPPTHPILKKSRGPSASGPRPTARFVSPHDTEEEDAKDTGEGSSSDAAVSVSIQQPPAVSPAVSPAKSAGKKPSSLTKKFVASSPASKRRPGMPRRPSSQSSNGSEPGSREGSVSGSSRYLAGSSLRSSVLAITEHSKDSTAAPRSQPEKVAISTPRREALSAKAAGKRPMAARSMSSDQQVQPASTAQQPNPASSFSQNRPVVVQAASSGAVPQSRPSDAPSGQARQPVYEVHRARNEMVRSSQPGVGGGPRGVGSLQAAAQRTSTDATKVTAHQPIETSRMVPQQPTNTARMASQQPPGAARAMPPPMARSRSYHEQGQRPRELSIGRAPPQGLISGATAETSNVAVRGSLIGTNDELSTPAIDVDHSFPKSTADTTELGSSLTTPSFLRRGGSSDLPSRPSSSSLLGDFGEPGPEPTVMASRLSTSSVLDSKFTPTLPTTSIVVPLGRSKSQLTLLLEREKARIGDKPRAKS